MKLPGQQECHARLAGGKELLFARRGHIVSILVKAARFSVLPGKKMSHAGVHHVKSIKQCRADNETRQRIRTVATLEHTLRRHANEGSFC